MGFTQLFGTRANGNSGHELLVGRGRWLSAPDFGTCHPTAFLSVALAAITRVIAL